MKIWMRKLFVILITVLTLGMYVPPFGMDTEAKDNDDAEDIHDHSFKVASDGQEFEAKNSFLDPDPVDVFLEELTAKAKNQTMTKLGPKIIEQVEDDLFTTIFPHMEDVIEKFVRTSSEDDVPYYEITEDPAQGVGERIFNVYDHKQDTVILKFHVRRDLRPLEGYWFNFHYHVKTDHFEKHYNIGEIYWDKNMPPKWMA